jgi:hypothetical protein
MNKFKHFTKFTATKGYHTITENSVDYSNFSAFASEELILSRLNNRAKKLESMGYTIEWFQEDFKDLADHGFMDVGGMTYNEVRFNTRGE